MTQPLGQVGVAFDVARIVLLFVTLGIAATTDVAHRRVSNNVTYPAIVLGLALAYGAGDLGDVDIGLGHATGHGLFGHLAGMLFGFTLFFIAWFARAVQGGEVKLAAAVGALGGFPFVIPAMFWASIVGAIMALWMAIFRGPGRLRHELRSAIRYGAGLGHSPLPPPSVPVAALAPAVTATAAAEPGERALANPDPTALHVPYAAALAFGTMIAFLLQEWHS